MDGKPTKTDSGGGALAASEPRSAVLARQVANKVDLEGKNAATAPVSLGKLLSLATAGEKCRLYAGWAFAALSGAILPTFFFFMGPVFDSFTVETTAEEARDKIREVCIIMACLAGGITVTSFCQNYLLMSTSALVAAKLKGTYLKAVLAQEAGWFD